MNYQNKGNTPRSSQMRMIYITLALSLAIMAVLVVLSGAWKRSNDKTDVEGTEDIMVTVPDIQVIAPSSEYEEENTAPADTEVTSETVNTEVTTAKPSAAELPIPEFVSPVSGYLMKEHSGDTPVFSITMNDYRPHIGVDISAAPGDDVFAAAAGTVKDIWEDPMSGNCISIEHNGGAVSIYRGIAPTLPDGISVGTEVSVGQVIATVGETSLLEVADEPHLHFELTVNGTSVNPAEYISFSNADTEYEG